MWMRGSMSKAWCSTSARAEGRGSAALLVGAAALFAVAIGYGAILPLLPATLAHLMPDAGPAARAAHTGTLTAAYLLAVLALAPVWGALSDRMGRRLALLVGLAGYSAALAAFPWAHSMTQAYVARLVAGAFAAAVLPAAAALVTETSWLFRRAARLAWLSAASLAGYLVGPAITGWVYALTQAAGASPAETLDAVIGRSVYAAAAVSVVAFVAAALVRPGAPSPDLQEATAGALPGATRLLAPVAVLSLLATFGLGAFEVEIAVFGGQRLGLTPASLAWIFAGCSVAMLLAQGLLGLVRRLEPRAAVSIVASGFAAMTIGFALLSFEGTPLTLAVAVALIGAGSGVMLPLLGYLAAARTHARIGVTLGVQTAAASFGQGAGSAAAGWLFGTLAEASFGVCALLMAIGAGGTLLVRPGFATARAARPATEARA